VPCTVGCSEQFPTLQGRKEGKKRKEGNTVGAKEGG
jgi:hypothetical protein